MPFITDYTIAKFDFGDSENQSVSDILLDVTEQFAFFMTSKQVSRAETFEVDMTNLCTGFACTVLSPEKYYLRCIFKIAKIDVRTCAAHVNCSQCLQHKFDPLDCGWCDGRCVSRDECVSEEFLRERCPPLLYSVG